MHAKFGRSPTVVSGEKGGYRQTDRQKDAAALYSRYGAGFRRYGGVKPNNL